MNKGYINTWLCCLTLAVLLMGSSAGADSIFINGLAVDSLEEPGKDDQPEDFFKGELKRFPLLPPRRPFGTFGMSLTEPRRAAQSSSALWDTDRGLQHMRRAQTFVDGGQWERARLEIEKALSYEPNNAFLLRRAAALSALAKKYGAADSYFRRSLELDPDNVPFLVGYAGVLIRIQRFEEAQQYLDRALELQPGYLAARFNQVCLKILMNDIESIEGGWEEAGFDQVVQIANWLEADQAELLELFSPEGFALLCNTVLGTGTADHLREIVNELRSAGNSMADGRYEFAIPSLQRLREFDLHSFWPKLSLAECYYQIGKKKESMTLLAETARKHPDSIYVWFNIGFIQVQSEEYARAIEAFERVLEISPDYKQGQFALACAYAGAGELDTAWPMLEELADWNPVVFAKWMEGDKPYLNAITEDARYPTLIPMVP